MENLTVSELAARLSRPNEDLEIVTNRLRNWTSAGFLSPAGEKHTGPGRPRRYDESAIFDAMILTAVTDLGLQAVRGTRFNALFSVARQGFAEVKRHNVNETVYLCFSAHPERDNCVYLYTGKGAYLGAEKTPSSRAHVLLPEALEGCIVLNLTVLYEQLLMRSSKQHLVVREPFDGYSKGDRITAPEIMDTILSGANSQNVVRVKKPSKTQ